MFSFLHRYLGIPYSMHSQKRLQDDSDRPTIVFLHGIGSSHANWRRVIEKLPDDQPYIALDFIGFGESHKPQWFSYDTESQLRSLRATLRRSGLLDKPIVIAGHSLGSLVAVAYAKRYPDHIRKLVLCSPPIYKQGSESKLQADVLLRKLYDRVGKTNHDTLIKLSRLVAKHGLAGDGFMMTKDTLLPYTKTLHSCIVEQTTFDDLLDITIPTTILKGTLDPFVVPRNLQDLAKRNPALRLQTLHGIGHEFNDRYVSACLKALYAAAP